MARPDATLITQGVQTGKYVIHSKNVVVYYEEISLGNGVFQLRHSHPITNFTYLCEVIVASPDSVVDSYGLTIEMLVNLPFYEEMPPDFERPYTLD